MSYFYVKPPMNEYRTVPLHLFQTWHSLTLPPLMTQCVNRLRQVNPEFVYHLYDDAMCREFIKSNFDSEVVYAYDTLIPGAYKADLWRYCILYVYGGIYLDIKYRCVSPFKLIELTTHEQYVRDREYAGNDGIYQALMVSYPKNPILYSCIQKIVSYVKQNHYGESCLFIGPQLVGSYFSKSELDQMNMKFIGTGITRKGQMILDIYPDYRHELRRSSRKKHYSELWLERNIYDYSKLIPCEVKTVPILDIVHAICLTPTTVVYITKQKTNHVISYTDKWGMCEFLPSHYKSIQVYHHEGRSYMVGLQDTPRGSKIYSGIYNESARLIRPVFHNSAVSETLWCMATYQDKPCILYSWYPLQVAQIHYEKGTLSILQTHYHVPPFFKDLYAATASVPWNGTQWVVLVKPNGYVVQNKLHIKNDYLWVVLNSSAEVIKYSEFFKEGIVTGLHVDASGITLVTTHGKCCLSTYTWKIIEDLRWTYNEAL